MKTRHQPEKVARAATLFFMVRGTVRQCLAQGKRLDPSAWLHIETMVFIAGRDGPSMREIAEYLSITAPSATSLIGNLANEGLVRRSADVRDRRAHRITLTPKGKRRLAAALKRGKAVFDRLFSSLSPAELDAFIRALERIRSQGER